MGGNHTKRLASGAIGVLLGLLLLSRAPAAKAQTAEFPQGMDLRNVTRPANSVLLGAMHIDNDEYKIPVGPFERRNSGRTTTVTGPVDVVVYGGPKTASSLTTYTGLASQLSAQGYTQTYACARQSCGDAYGLVTMLAQPLVDSLHEGDWGGKIIDSVWPNSGDARYGVFTKGGEYLVVGVLSPGQRSGAMLIRLNGPAAEAVLRVAN